MVDSKENDKFDLEVKGLRGSRLLDMLFLSASNV